MNNQSLLPSYDGDAAQATRRDWAAPLIRFAPQAPAYGTPAWGALPNTDPAKLAAAIRAAECWATRADNLEEDLRYELEALAQAHKHEEDAAYIARRDAHKHAWTPQGFKPHRGQQQEIEAEWTAWIHGDDAA